MGLLVGDDAREKVSMVKRVRVLVFSEPPWTSEQVLEFKGLTDMEVEQLKQLLKRVKFAPKEKVKS